MKVLLLSGGIDSTALAWWQRPDVCVTINYGQLPAKGEIAAGRAIATEFRLRHELIEADLSSLGSGLLTGRNAAIHAKAPEWWPYRNQLLITLAGMRFMSKGLTEIMIGAVATDVHNDGHAPFLRTIDRLMSLQEGMVRVTSPAQKLSSLGLLQAANFPDEYLALTFSCHVHEFPCGQCRGCEKHRRTTSRYKKITKLAVSPSYLRFR